MTGRVSYTTNKHHLGPTRRKAAQSVYTK